MTLEVCCTAIKTGRYTHAKKAQDITEVKMLAEKHHHHQQQLVTSSGCVDQHSSSSSRTSPEDSSDAAAVSSSAAVKSTGVYSQLMMVTEALSAAGDNSAQSSPLSDDDLPRATAEPQTTSTDLEQIIQHITNVHLSQTPLTADFIAALPEREKQYFVRMMITYSTRHMSLTDGILYV